MDARTVECHYAEQLLNLLKKPLLIESLTLRDITDADVVARVAECSNLETLNVAMCAPEGLAARLGDLTKLRKLTFQRCGLGAIPPAIMELADLESLDLGNNSIAVVPAEIGALKSLTMLRLMQNRITSLPEALFDLPLKSLNLGYNQLSELPEAVGRMASLEVLFLGVNKLEEIPGSIGNLSALTMLGLASNELHTLPASLADLTNLQHVDLEKNPFQSLPGEMARLAETVPDFKLDGKNRSLFEDWTYPVGERAPVLSAEAMRLMMDDEDPSYENLITRLDDISALEVASLVRRAIIVRSTDPDSYDTTGSSRLGGFPDLESADHFPATDGAYCAFLAQINLADIADLNAFLPRDGLLSFFIRSTEHLAATVLYTEAGVALKTIRIDPDEMFDPEDDYSATPHQVQFEPAPHLPHLFKPYEGDEEAYERLRADLAKDAAHTINGYTFTQHESPQEQAASVMRGTPEEWVPLLKLGYDSAVGFCFWDAGTITFSIHREALSRQDFSNVHGSLYSS